MDDAIRRLEQRIGELIEESGSAELRRLWIAKETLQSLQPQSSSRFGSMTIVKAARKAFVECGTPLNAQKLADLLVAGGIETRSKNFKDALVSALKTAGEKEGVVRVGPGLWGLEEWRKRGAKAAAEAANLFKDQQALEN